MKYDIKERIRPYIFENLCLIPIDVVFIVVMVLIGILSGWKFLFAAVPLLVLLFVLEHGVEELVVTYTKYAKIILFVEVPAEVKEKLKLSKREEQKLEKALKTINYQV